MKCRTLANLFLAHIDSSFPSFPLPLILLKRLPPGLNKAEGKVYFKDDRKCMLRQRK